MRVLRSVLLATVMLHAVGLNSAVAQTAENPAPESEEAAPAPVVVEPIAPYDDKLLRLAEVLGSVHYLRAICGANEGNKWRDIMSGLLKSEEPGPKRKARLVAHFNRGFRAFDGTYTSCTASALLASNKYVQEGILLSSQITGRYGR